MTDAHVPACPHRRALGAAAFLLLLRSAGTAHAASADPADVVPARATDSDEAAGWPALRDGSILLLRHANAPGIGDPAGFSLGDCRTQRNLDAAGRAQARFIGEAFRRHAVPVGAVLSSPWCRTHETAELAFPGRVEDDARFNSFFDDHPRSAAMTRAAVARLRQWHGPGVMVVVTHQVNITALTGVVPAAGEGVVVVADASGLKTIGRLRP